jgi:tryptophanase
MTRDELLQAAGFNLLDLEPEATTLDFFSDAPERSPVAEVASAEATAVVEGARRPDLSALISALYGDAPVTFLTKGRAAELALVEALGLQRPVVLTHGLFATTTRALTLGGAVIERLPTSRAPGTADLDLDQLRPRLAAAGAGALIWLEPANNTLAGWPLSLDHVARVRELCDHHGARLVFDATRVLTNGALLGVNPVACARAMLALADAFTISCAKELLVPTGALVGARDAELIGRVSAIAFTHGTSLDRISAQVALARGAQIVAAAPHLIARRNDKTRALAERLSRRGLAVVMPSGGHAVFVELARVAMPTMDVPQLFSLLGHLFAVSGVRAQIVPRGERPPLLRLALALERFGDGELDEAAAGVAAFMSSLDRAPKLRASPGQDHVAPLHRRYEVV